MFLGVFPRGRKTEEGVKKGAAGAISTHGQKLK
jgi:hypothetical protein